MIYVDKTGLIATIAKERVPIFFSRPRRFGKTLLINTMHCLFETGLQYFHGLDIEKVWDDTTYKVVHIDFSSLADKNPAMFAVDLGETIIQKFRMNTLVSQMYCSRIRSPDRILDEICEGLQKKSVVLLIDEYDAPLTHHLGKDDELQEIASILNDFYAVIKQYSSKFRFIFITGITRASHVSIFSAFNNIIDISLDPEYNALLGFTQNDIRCFFDDFVENAAHILQMSKEDVYQRLEQYYDGYQFAIDAEETVYNPWSVINFLMRPRNGFCNYWFKSSGSSSIIMKYVKTSHLFESLTYDKLQQYITEESLSDRYEISNLPLWVLLFQTGYVSIRKKADGVARFVFPNTEVEDSMLKVCFLENNIEPDIKFSEEIQKIAQDIDQRRLGDIVKIFNAILNECVSILSNIFNDERSVRDILYTALPQKIDFQKMKERETVKGRSDLELITKKTHMVIEFKRAKNERDAGSSLQNAIEQMERKRYGIGFYGKRDLYRVCMVISSDEKKILENYCMEL